MKYWSVLRLVRGRYQVLPISPMMWRGRKFRLKKPRKIWETLQPSKRNLTPSKPNFPLNSAIFKKRLLSTRKQMSVRHASKGLPTTIKKLLSHQDKRKFKNSLLEWRNSRKNLQNLKNSLRKMRFFPNKFLG